MHSEYELSQPLTFCWGADGILVFSRLCKCLGETLSDILETKQSVTISNVTDTHPPCFRFIFLIFFCMVFACKHDVIKSIFVVHINKGTGVGKQVSAFLTITQTLMLFVLCDMHLVTCASEPVIAHSTHLLTAFCYNHSLFLGVFWISTKCDQIPRYACKYINKKKRK